MIRPDVCGVSFQMLVTAATTDPTSRMSIASNIQPVPETINSLR